MGKVGGQLSMAETGQEGTVCSHPLSSSWPVLTSRDGEGSATLVKAVLEWDTHRSS